MFHKLERFVFVHLVELLTFGGLAILLFVAGMAWYDRSSSTSEAVQALKTLKSMVTALELYSFENPGARVFPPALGEQPSNGDIVLCPVRENNQAGLGFLTTPAPYLGAIPADPFMSRATGRNGHPPVALRWVRGEAGGDNGHRHIGWGAMNVGPALELPPMYDITVLQQVPYFAKPLRENLYDPTNGMNSYGILYHDSLGNHNSLGRR